MVQREDAGGTITYQYNAAGQPVEISSNGSTTRIVYDEYGRQTALKDPNAGTIKYDYYADGQLKYQVDAKGDSTVITYDKAGRQENKLLYDKRDNTVTKTTYAYKNSGNGIGQIASVTHSVNGSETHKQSFEYNANHLLESVTDRYEGQDYTFSYTYDDLWRPLTTTSPGGLVVENKYDDLGNLIKINSGTKTLWELKEQNAEGHISAYTLGNGLNAAYSYTPAGMPEEQTVKKGNTVIQQMRYGYHPETYSLTLRDNVKNNRRETFVYDDMDRLILTKLNGVTLDSLLYEPNGNIASKTGVGTYLYNDSRPHAMAGIQSGTQGDEITGILQEIEYTAFNKVSSVQHSEGNNDRYEILYGLDQQRIKTSYYTDGQKQYDRYYFGSYEKEVGKDGNIIHIDYIYSPAGLTAIRKMAPSVSPTVGEPTMYYVHTDNLGSIQVITDSEGNVKEEYAYTAWGGRIALIESPLGELGVSSLGYTGHEHLEPLGLINMNGRIYDPSLARFLSPDPYVQAPDFTQGFNRYSYCWNNPFKYTDPSGEWVHIVVGAVVGGVANLVLNWDNIDGFWQGLAAVGVGAGAGALTAATGGAGAGAWAVAGVGAAGGAVTSATNNIIAQTGENFSGFGNMDWEQIGFSTVTGGVAGFAGGAAGSWAANSDWLINGVNSPIMRSMIVSPIASGAGHVAGGTTYNLLDGQNLGNAFSNSFNGIGQSMVIGTATGAVSTIATSYANGINPFNGKSLSSHTKSQTISRTYDFTLDEFGDNVTLYRGTTGSEGNNGQPLFMTDNADYAASYVKNGGTVQKITISRLTLQKMYHNGDVNILIGTHAIGNSNLIVNEYSFSPSLKPLIIDRFISR